MDELEKLKRFIRNNKNELSELYSKIDDLEEQIEHYEDLITILKKSIKNNEKEIEVLENEKV